MPPLKRFGNSFAGKISSGNPYSIYRTLLLFSPFFFLLLSFYSCRTPEVPLRTEPGPEAAAPFVSPEELFKAGKTELQRFTIPGYREAVHCFEQVLKIKPGFPGAYGRLAVAYGLWARERKDLGLDNLEQWVKSFYYASKAREEGQTADFLKASSLIKNSRDVIGRREYQEYFNDISNRFEKESPVYALSYLRDLFSTGYFKKSTINPALEDLDKALQENPDDAEALVFKSLVQMATAEDGNLKKALSLEPDWPLPYFLIGLFYKNRGEAEQAEKWFNLTLEKNPEHPRALAELGELAFLGKRYEEAEKALDWALTLDPEMPRAGLLAGLILREKGEYRQALYRFKSVTDLVSDHEEALYYRALILIELADWSGSLESLEALIKIGGSYEIFGYALRALSFLMLDRPVEAEADCGRALEISPNYYLPYYIRGLISFRRQEWKEAGEDFSQSLKIDKTFDDGHYYLGQTYLKLKDNKKTREELTRAAELFEFEARQAERLSADAREKGWPAKAELFVKRKDELEAKARHCRQLLADL